MLNHDKSFSFFTKFKKILVTGISLPPISAFETSFPYVQFIVTLLFISQKSAISTLKQTKTRGIAGKPTGDPHGSRTSPVFVHFANFIIRRMLNLRVHLYNHKG